MIIDIEKYLIPLEDVDLTNILSTWTWLTGDKIIVALTKSGDALLRNKNGHLYFLDIGNGTLEFKAVNYRDLLENKLDNELTKELLLPSLIDELERAGIILKSKQVYSYT